MKFDTDLWRHFLYSGKKGKKTADLMRRAHNRAILSLAINPRQRLHNWNIDFEQKGIDTHAIRIAANDERVGC